MNAHAGAVEATPTRRRRPAAVASADASGTAAVKSALRTLQIFELFGQRQHALQLSEIARALQCPKSSCLALLATLSERGYLERVADDGSYRPTRLWLHQAQLATRHHDRAQQLHDSLVRLRDATGETAISATLVNERSAYLDVVESTELVRYSARPGEFRPLAVSASGRALLGVLDEARRAALLDRLYAGSDRPKTSRRTLERLVADEQARGWSVNVGGYRPDVVSVGVGFRLDGSALALVIGAPRSRGEPQADRIGRQLARERQDLLGRLA